MLKTARGASMAKSSGVRSRKGSSKKATSQAIVGKLVTIIAKDGATLTSRAERLKGKLPAHRMFKFKKMLSEQKRRLDAFKQASHRLVAEVVRLEPEIGRAEVDDFVNSI